jgi:hypothetical protein
MLRYAQEHHPDALRTRLADALAGELEPLAEAVARLQGGRK